LEKAHYNFSLILYRRLEILTYLLYRHPFGLVTGFAGLSKLLTTKNYDSVEAESQAVPNTLTEHDRQDAFKNDKNSGNDKYVHKGTIWRAVVVNRP
jgi:hypothetical protein